MQIEELETLAVTLFEIEAVRFGRFQLHSGKRSPIYIDLRVLVSHPDALRQVARAYATVLAKKKFDLLAAYPYAGLPIGVAISLEMNVPLIYPRKTGKSYGTGKQIEGQWEVGQRVILIEDLITSGKSIMEAIAALKAAGLQAKESLVLIDRQQDGVKTLREQGHKVESIMTLTDMLAFLEKHDCISSQRRAGVLRSLELA